MAKTKKTGKKNENRNEDNNEDTIEQVPQTPVIIHAQYLKDMSFENPNAPQILRRGKKPPDMNMDISMNVRRLEDDEIEHFYEVALTVNASAKREDKTMFIAEITYCAAVSINGLEEKKHHPLLLIEVPHMIFPFARLLLANATQAGSFTALQLGPVDFRAMYLERFGKKQADDVPKTG